MKYYKRNGITYTSVYLFKGKICCLYNKVHPDFIPKKYNFTHKGKVYSEVKIKNG